ncbi:hypothetical protein GCM10010103_76040 [Streptomyces paradoxus]
MDDHLIVGGERQACGSQAAVGSGHAQNDAMRRALIIIGEPLPGGGRPVVVRCPEAERCLGVAHSDGDLVAFLRDVGLPHDELDDSSWVEWCGAGPHQWEGHHA